MKSHVPEQDAEVSSLAQKAYEQIETMIVTGVLKPNSLISEGDLVEQLAFGRTPIREALQRLKYTGLVDILPRKGILIKPVDVLSQLDLLEVRRPLEEVMVRLACRRATRQERNRMREIADQLEQTAREAVEDQDPSSFDAGRFLEINRIAHLLEAQAARNTVLEESIGLIYSLSRRFWYTHLNDIDSFSEAARWRIDVLRRIAGGEEEAAISSARGMIDFLEKATRKAIDIRLDRL